MGHSFPYRSLSRPTGSLHPPKNPSICSSFLQASRLTVDKTLDVCVETRKQTVSFNKEEIVLQTSAEVNEVMTLKNMILDRRANFFSPLNADEI